MGESYDLRSHLREFKKLGYTVFPALFDAASVEGWKRTFHELQSAGAVTNPGNSWWYANTCELAPTVMLPAVANPVLLDFCELVLGPFVQLDNLTLAGFPSIAAADAEGKTSGWHRDRWSHVPRGDAYQRPLAVNAISYLQDLTPEFGPLRVIPGSHRKAITIDSEQKSRPHPQEKLIHMKAGDVVLVHNGLLHSGTPNTSGKVRYFFSIYYNLTWLKHTDTHDGPNVQAIVAKARERNDQRMLRLFGIDDNLQLRANCGFDRPDEPRWAEWSASDKAALKQSG